MGAARRYLALLVAVRVAIPLAALAASGSKLPALPRYRFVALTGDATGFYAAARELIASLAAPVLAVALVVVAALWWRGRLRSPRALVAAAFVVSLLLVVPISRMHPPGAAVAGWSLLWSVPLLPLRAIGQLTPNSAFAVGLVLSLAANAVTVVASFLAGTWATGRRTVGLGAATIFALWPLLAAGVAGTSAWGNGSWTVDAGLALYTEPLSTALMTSALALLLWPRAADGALAAAGLLLGYATVTRLSNGIVAALAVGIVWLLRDRRAATWVAAGGLAFAPVVAAYWPKGYAAQFSNAQSWPRDPFALHWVAHNWSASLLFTPRALVVLVPVALAGAAFLRSRYALALLLAWIAANAVLYSFYRVTWEHPRFLYASLPALFVLWTAGAASAANTATSVRSRAKTSQSSARNETTSS
jgi:hypothetical protein